MAVRGVATPPSFFFYRWGAGSEKTHIAVLPTRKFESVELRTSVTFHAKKFLLSHRNFLSVSLFFPLSLFLSLIAYSHTPENTYKSVLEILTKLFLIFLPSKPQFSTRTHFAAVLYASKDNTHTWLSVILKKKKKIIFFLNNKYRTLDIFGHVHVTSFNFKLSRQFLRQ